ncbi:hypothetical protein PIB30_075813, partial [Stylosanthes scabra]|nr:hypothetical protein [Stylosanthes scabra]
MFSVKSLLLARGASRPTYIEASLIFYHDGRATLLPVEEENGGRSAFKKYSNTQ